MSSALRITCSSQEGSHIGLTSGGKTTEEACREDCGHMMKRHSDKPLQSRSPRAEPQKWDERSRIPGKSYKKY